MTRVVVRQSWEESERGWGGSARRLFASPHSVRPKRLRQSLLG